MLVQRRQRLAWVPFILPYVVFLLFGVLENTAGKELYPFVYATKLVIVSSLIYILRRGYTALRAQKPNLLIAIPLGLALGAAWVVIDRYTPHFSVLGSRIGYNPFVAIHSPVLAWLFILIRMAGLVVVAPAVEELFLRGFVLRYIVKPDDFSRVPIGDYDRTAFWVVVALTAFTHPEYLAAIAFAVCINVLYVKTRSFSACVIAHAAANLALGCIVLYCHYWRLW